MKCFLPFPHFSMVHIGSYYLLVSMLLISILTTVLFERGPLLHCITCLCILSALFHSLTLESLHEQFGTFVIDLDTAAPFPKDQYFVMLLSFSEFPAA